MKNEDLIEYIKSYSYPDEMEVVMTHTGTGSIFFIASIKYKDQFYSLYFYMEKNKPIILVFLDNDERERKQVAPANIEGFKSAIDWIMTLKQ